jgi:hypothetical protein
VTKETDQLIALSAVIKIVMSAWNNQCLAGVPKSCAIKFVFWITPTPSTRFRRYRAPSWSWASMNGPITFQWHSNRPPKNLCNVLDIRADKDFNLPMLRGLLTLRGNTYRLPKLTRHRQLSSLTTDGFIIWELFLDDVISSWVGPGVELLLCTNTGPGTAGFMLLRPVRQTLGDT